MNSFRRLYGAGPLHLTMMAVCLGIGLWVVAKIGVPNLWNPDVWWQSIAVWFVGAALVHDLVLLPLYSALDRGLVGVSRRWFGRRMVNAVRIPTLGAGLSLLVFFPGIVSQGGDDYLAATGMTQEPFLDRWLLLVVVLYAGSALWFTTARLRHRLRPHLST